MALLSSSISCSPTTSTLNYKIHSEFQYIRRRSSAGTVFPRRSLRQLSSLHVCTPDQEQSLSIDKSLLIVEETTSEDEFWAAACLRVRSFYAFRPNCYGIEDHKKYLAEREFEAMKERAAGKRTGFRKVSCINATLPSSNLWTFSDDLLAVCKYTHDGEDRVVVGSLDLNQCLRLPDEITGMRPEGIGADFARAYLSNVCVAKELQRNGLGYKLVEKSQILAQEWGITDLYVHVAVDNEPAKKLYMKSGFIYESDEPAWQARYLDRPRRILLWMGLPGVNDL